MVKRVVGCSHKKYLLKHEFLEKSLGNPNNYKSLTVYGHENF
jgi:hypothetical protein